jgi:hypothetical protein
MEQPPVLYLEKIDALLTVAILQCQVALVFRYEALDFGEETPTFKFEMSCKMLFACALMTRA